MIMKVDKFQDLQSHAGDHRRTDGECSPSLNTGRPKTQEELMFQLESESKKKKKSCCLSSKAVRHKEFFLCRRAKFLFYQGLWMIGWSPPTLGRAIWFSLPTHMLITSRNSHRYTQNNIRSNVWAPCGPVRLSHTVNRNIWQGTICCHGRDFYQSLICQ